MLIKRYLYSHETYKINLKQNNFKLSKLDLQGLFVIEVITLLGKLLKRRRDCTFPRG